MRLPNICPDREIIFMLLYGLIAASSLIGTGTTLGYSAVALPVLVGNSTVVTLNSQEIPLFASLPTISQIFGSLASLITMKEGRRVAIGTGTAVCTIGWFVISVSSDVLTLFIGRAITGFSMGLCAAAAAVYIGEISRARWRAACTVAPSLFIATGVVTVYFFGFLMQDSWKGVAGACVVLPAISMISTIFLLPESPVWLLTKDRERDARNSLRRIRGCLEENVRFQTEFEELAKYVEARKNASESFEGSSFVVGLWWKTKGMMNAFKLPEVWKPFLILNCYFFFQQFSGTYIMMSYAVNILMEIGLTSNPFFTTVLLGLIQVITGVVSIFCGVGIGRRPISLLSALGISLSLLILGLNIQFLALDGAPALSSVCIIVFAAAGAFGLIMLPWAMIGELYPARYINFLGPMTTSFAALFNFVAVQLYPGFVKSYGIVTAIYFFFIVSATATIFLAYLLPETLNKTRTEIEEGFKKCPAKQGR